MSLPARAALAACVALLAAAPGARGAVPAYTRCLAPTGLVQAYGATCTVALALAADAAAAPPTAAPAALRHAGWEPLLAVSVPGSTRAAFDVVAVRHRAAVRLRLPGQAPDLDGWAAGRELVFARAVLAGGRPIPDGAALCTSSFLIHLAGTLGGLSAAHCAGLRSDGTTERRNAALRRPPAPGIVLGRVQRILTRTKPLDALVLPVPRGSSRSAGAVVERGISRPPSAVAGIARPLGGRTVCFTGRTSGADRCGRIRGDGALPAEALLSARAGVEVLCTTVRAAPGDSGGPVYTAPAADGSVRAVGIAELIIGPAHRLCFTPIHPVLTALHATLAVQR